jgi:hypothetical protein
MRDFHRPFLWELVFVALATVSCMISARFFILNSKINPSNTPIFTSQEFQFQNESQGK